MAKTDKRSIKISAAEIPPAWVKTAPDPGIPSLKTPDPGLTSEWQKKLKTPDPGLVPERVEHVLGTERAAIDSFPAAQDIRKTGPVSEPAKTTPLIAKLKKSRKRAIYEGRQSVRARAVLKRMFSPDGICPTRAELPDVDLFDGFRKEYDSVEGKRSSRLKMPSDSVVLREAGRKDKK